MSYNMSDDRITRAAARLVAAWALIAVLTVSAVGCKTHKPTVDDDHWDNQNEVIP